MRDHYRLLPTDPRWLALDDEQVMAIYYSHQYAKNGVPEEVVDPNFDENEENLEALFGLEKAAEPVPPEEEFEEVINDWRN